MDQPFRNWKGPDATHNLSIIMHRAVMQGNLASKGGMDDHHEPGTGLLYGDVRLVLTLGSVQGECGACCADKVPPKKSRSSTLGTIQPQAYTRKSTITTRTSP